MSTAYVCLYKQSMALIRQLGGTGSHQTTRSLKLPCYLPSRLLKAQHIVSVECCSYWCQSGCLDLHEIRAVCGSLLACSCFFFAWLKPVHYHLLPHHCEAPSAVPVRWNSLILRMLLTSDGLPFHSEHIRWAEEESYFVTSPDILCGVTGSTKFKVIQ